MAARHLLGGQHDHAVKGVAETPAGERVPGLVVAGQWAPARADAGEKRVVRAGGHRSVPGPRRDGRRAADAPAGTTRYGSTRMIFATLGTPLASMANSIQ